MDEPAHGRSPLAVKVTVGRIIEAVGRILHQTLVVRPGVALDRRHDERRVGVVQIVCQPPALAEGGVFVKKDILAVEHVQHRIPAVRVGFVHGGQIDINTALLGAVDSGVADAPFLDHGPGPSQSSYSMLSLAPSRQNCNSEPRPQGRLRCKAPERLIQQTPPGELPDGACRTRNKERNLQLSTSSPPERSSPWCRAACPTASRSWCRTASG